MRQDQIERLTELSEKLAEVVLEECDPETWPGAGKPLPEMTRDERGDRYWCKKNASGTFSLLERTITLIASGSKITPPSADPDDEGDMDKQIDAKEKEAEKILARVLDKAKGVKARGKA